MVCRARFYNGQLVDRRSSAIRRQLFEERGVTRMVPNLAYVGDWGQGMNNSDAMHLRGLLRTRS
jgi:hypothetical protein